MAHWWKPLAAGGSLLLCIAVVDIVLFSRAETHREKVRLLRLNTLGFAVLFLAFCSRYVWRKLAYFLRPTSRGGLAEALKLPLTVALFLILFLGTTSIIIGLLLVDKEPHWLPLTSSFCLGVLILSSFSFFVADIVEFLLSHVCGGKGSWKRVKLVLAVIAGLCLIVFGRIGASMLKLQHVTVPIKGLSSRLNGTTVIQLSDIHLGPFIGRQRTASIVEQVNQQRPDMVMITGDLVDASVKDLWAAVEPLADLKTTHGVYYCTGNHEYYTGDVDNWLQDLPKLGIVTLVNDRVCLFSYDKTSCHGGLYVAGIEDYETRRIRYGAHSMDLHRALTGRHKAVPTIVLAHQPNAAAEAVLWDDVRLVLSGHTHAGQVLPFMLPVYLFNPFFAGLYNPRDDVYVYVSAGTSSYHIPFRHYRPEITKITLTTS